MTDVLAEGCTLVDHDQEPLEPNLCAVLADRKSIIQGNAAHMK